MTTVAMKRVILRGVAFPRGKRDVEIYVTISRQEAEEVAHRYRATGFKVEVVTGDPGKVWRPAGVKAPTEEREELPAEAQVFEYRGELFEFAGVVELSAAEQLEMGERNTGWCLYGYPLDRPHSRPDLPGLIFNHREVRALTPAMRAIVGSHEVDEDEVHTRAVRLRYDDEDDRECPF